VKTRFGLLKSGHRNEIQTLEYSVCVVHSSDWNEQVLNRGSAIRTLTLCSTIGVPSIRAPVGLVHISSEGSMSFDTVTFAVSMRRCDPRDEEYIVARPRSAITK